MAPGGPILAGTMRPMVPRQTRRGFLRSSLTLAGLALLSGCGVAPAVTPWSPASKVPRIGFLSGRAPEPSPEAAAFREGLAQLGYRPEQGARLEVRFAHDPAAMDARAAELVQAGVDLTVATTTAAARAARRGSGTLPIVFVGLPDPVGAGLVASLARPGGNVTGLSSLSAGLGAKRLELLKEAVPNAARVAVIRRADDPEYTLEQRQLEPAAAQLGLRLVPIDARPGIDLGAQLDAEGRLDAAILFFDSLFGSTYSLADMAPLRRLPTVWADRAYVAPPRPELPAGLMSYAADRPALFRRAATFVDRILKGAKPADLPVEEPVSFDFVVNLKAARALGLTVPESILLQATELIQ